MVTLEVTAVTPDDRHIEITAKIAAPAQVEDGGWMCAVEVLPLQSHVLNVRGVDSFHATWLACSLILKLLANLKGDGGRLLNRDGTDFPLAAYLVGLDEKP